MAKEIERKFLVTGRFRTEAAKAVRIVQGYLSSVAERAVRVRIKGEKGYLAKTFLFSWPVFPFFGFRG